VSVHAEYYRRKAVACWRAANRTRDPQRKREFEQLAQAWLRLAERAEREPEWRIRFMNNSKKTD
jgi:hypothetical protein